MGVPPPPSYLSALGFVRAATALDSASAIVSPDRLPVDLGWRRRGDPCCPCLAGSSEKKANLLLMARGVTRVGAETPASPGNSSPEPLRALLPPALVSRASVGGSNEPKVQNCVCRRCPPGATSSCVWITPSNVELHLDKPDRLRPRTPTDVRKTKKQI